MTGLIAGVALWTVATSSINNTLSLAQWTTSNAYSGVKYLVWGRAKSPELIKLEAIEDQLQCKNTPDLEYYWDIQDKYDHGTWLVIKNQSLIFITIEKQEALKTIIELMEEGTDFKYLLIQVGNEKRHAIL